MQSEIEKIDSELDQMFTDQVKLSKEDVIACVIIGLLAGATDLLIGRPANGYNGFLKPTEPKIPGILKKYDLSNNPIDTVVPGISVGDHRLYSYGHDILRPFEAAKLMLNGTGNVGVTPDGGILKIAIADPNWISQFQNAGITPNSLTSLPQLAIVYFLHMYKDFWTPRSLPIPGITYIADLNNHTMPKILDTLVNEKELNLRTLTGQLSALAIIELLSRLYVFLKFKGKEAPQNVKELLRDKIILLSATFGLSVNIFKVLLTRNIVFLNFPLIIALIRPALNVIKNIGERNYLENKRLLLKSQKNCIEIAKTCYLIDYSQECFERVENYVTGKLNEWKEIENHSSSEIERLILENKKLLNELE